MRITQVESFEVRVPWVERVREEMPKAGMQVYGTHSFIYKVHTDDGLIGFADGPDVRSLVPNVLGRSPFEFILDDSIGALQAGMYDLMGKHLGLPVSKLFGPVYRTSVNVGYWSHCFPPEVLAKEALMAAENGFTAYKFKARPARDPVEQVKAIFQATPELELIVDANCTLWLPSKAVKVAKAIERCNVLCLESPIPQQNVDGYLEIKTKTNIPLAMHMGWGSGAEWTPNPLTAVEKHMVDYFVVEEHGAAATLESGIIAEKALGDASASGGYAVGGMPLWVEFVGLGPAEALGIHTAAAMKTAVLPSITFVFSHFLFEDDLIEEPLTIKDGEVKVPQKPGLGVTLDERALQRFCIK